MDTDNDKPKRRMVDKLEVVEMDGKITEEDLTTIKEIVRYWQSGRTLAIVLFSLGGLVVMALNAWSFVSERMK